MNSETIFYVGIAIALAATLWGRVIRERGIEPNRWIDGMATA